MARHAMAVYDRATKAVPTEQQHEMFNIYIRRAAELYGVTHTRPIYEKAVEVLPTHHAKDFCIRFAELETKLGEVDRARAIYSHCSHMCDPRVTADFWQTWKDFEVKHGNEDTLREMLRIKRSVQATYNTQVNMMASAMMSSSSGTGTVADLAPGLSMGLKDDMWRLEAKGMESDVKNAEKPTEKGSNIMFVRGETQSQAVQESVTAANPDEIDIDDDDDDDDDEDDNEEESSNTRKAAGEVEEMDVPDKVFGSLKKDD